MQKLNIYKCLHPRVAEPDPHCFWKLDPDPDLHSEASVAQNRAVHAHNGGLEAHNGALEGLQTSDRRFPIP